MRGFPSYALSVPEKKQHETLPRRDRRRAKFVDARFVEPRFESRPSTPESSTPTRGFSLPLPISSQNYVADSFWLGLDDDSDDDDATPTNQPRRRPLNASTSHSLIFGLEF